MLSDAGTSAPRHAPARRTHENERRPTLERDAAHEREAAGAIAGDRSACLGRKQTREHDLSVGRNEPRHRRSERFERIEQDIGKDQAVGRAGTQRRVVPWWPVPNASAASISMPIRFARTWAR